MLNRTFKLSSLLALVFLLSMVFSASAFADPTNSNKDITSGCGCAGNSGDTLPQLSQTEKDAAIATALADQNTMDYINSAITAGYQLKPEETVVRENSSGQINVVFLLYKSDTDYKAVMHNSTGFTDVVVVKDGNYHFGDGDVQPRVYCWLCVTTCAGLIEIPPAFLSCVALCTAMCA
ncbi:hypothetical protein [Paenibacillus sp. GCM10027626]|uniref:hypothetical protein n=1 Tax=Paenibacillus sp. GCM10027626 TaxID=3273411 RepID=UPI003637C517